MKIKLKVVPSSSRDSIESWMGEQLKIKVKAPPEKGKANKAVIKRLEKTLELDKGSIEITSGATSSSKTIEINYEDSNRIGTKLAAIVNQQSQL